MANEIEEKARILCTTVEQGKNSKEEEMTHFAQSHSEQSKMRTVNHLLKAKIVLVVCWGRKSDEWTKKGSKGQERVGTGNPSKEFC